MAQFFGIFFCYCLQKLPINRNVSIACTNPFKTHCSVTGYSHSLISLFWWTHGFSLQSFEFSFSFKKSRERTCGNSKFLYVSTFFLLLFMVALMTVTFSTGDVLSLCLSLAIFVAHSLWETGKLHQHEYYSRPLLIRDWQRWRENGLKMSFLRQFGNARCHSVGYDRAPISSLLPATHLLPPPLFFGPDQSSLPTCIE